MILWERRIPDTYIKLVPVPRIVHGEGTSGSILNQLNLKQILEAGLSSLSALNCIAREHLERQAEFHASTQDEA